MKARRIVALLLLGFLFTQTSYAQRVEGGLKPHSSKRASIYSAILPGMGQVYNRQIWKVPIIYALGATTTYIAIDNYRNSIKFKNEYFNRLNGNTSQLLSDYASYSDESILSLHEAYNKNFQLNQSFFAKKAEELGIKLPIEVVLPIVTPVQNQVVNNKPNPKTNTNN